ncbi:MAG TPA: PAS domain S-box protein [Candidatus Angelobacter sp.]
MEPVRFFVYLQLLLTAFLVALLWCFYARLRKQEFFRWWAWAWTASGAYLALGVLALQLTSAWTPLKPLVGALSLCCGFLQVPLLVFGARTLRHPGTSGQRKLWLAMGGALAAGILFFALSSRLSLLGYGLRQASRSLALALALIYCAAIFVTQWRKKSSSAVGISGIFCVLYAINLSFYTAAFLDRIVIGTNASLNWFFATTSLLRIQFLFLDLVYVCGICLGMVLLLVEEHRDAEQALLEAARHGQAVSESNLSLQAEISERMRVEDVLRESEAKFRLMAETVSCGIWIHQDGRFRYFNPPVVAITGYSPQELEQMAIWDLVHPMFKEKVQEFAKARVRGDKIPTRYEFKIVNRHGEERWLDFSAALIQYQGRPAVLASAFDITAAKRNEQEIKERTAYLQALISNSPLGIAVIDANHRVQFCNRAFEVMFQYSQTELAGQDLDRFIAPATDEAVEFTQRIEHGESIHAITRRQRKDGSLLDVELHGVPLLMDGRLVGVYAIYLDITERKHAEENLRNLTFRLIQIQEEERARLARELHDDVNQRLAVMAFRLDHLKQECKEPALNEQLETLSKIAHGVCTDIRHVARHLHPSHLEIVGLVSALAGFCLEYGKQNGIGVEFVHSRVPETLPKELTLCLYRVAQEAVHNAHKHSGTGKIQVELTADLKSLRLVVSDSGTGFDPDQARSGAGLGLVSMAERLHGVGGEFRIQSHPGGGTCVEACAPLPRRAAAS